MRHQVGDKIEVLTRGPIKGVRAVIRAVRGTVLQVELAGTGNEIELQSREVRNYSLAARKAWKSMPKRRVGRPRGSRRCNRVSVTVRVDRELWDRFKALEKLGKIKQRSEVLNTTLKHIVGSIDSASVESFEPQPEIRKQNAEL